VSGALEPSSFTMTLSREMFMNWIPSESPSFFTVLIHALPMNIRVAFTACPVVMFAIEFERPTRMNVYGVERFVKVNPKKSMLSYSESHEVRCGNSEAYTMLHPVKDAATLCNNILLLCTEFFEGELGTELTCDGGAWVRTHDVVQETRHGEKDRARHKIKCTVRGGAHTEECADVHSVQKKVCCVQGRDGACEWVWG